MRNGRINSTNLLELLPIFIMLGLILLFFWKMAFTNLILARGDTFLYFYPYWQAAAEALRAGYVPFWNPEIFMGAPLLANSQMGFFYPLNWPVWLIFSPPYAVKASILIHIFIAGLGTYVAARKVMVVGRAAALLAALSFTLGGYFSAQAEHVNQFQGLAWLPWFLAAATWINSPERYKQLLALLLLALLFYFQLLAGHTQTAFITGMGMALWQISRLVYRKRIGSAENEKQRKSIWLNIKPFVLLGAAVLLAFLISAAQILPTWELSQLSARQGGLPANEVLSFSLPPLLLVRSLLPAFNQSLFSEYVAFFPLTFLSLAFIASWQWRKVEPVFPASVWIIFGFLLALGVFNPMYWLLARLPVFNLFRAPSRWMVLYALGVSLLAGVGLQLLIDLVKQKNSGGKIQFLRFTKPLKIFLAAVIILFVWDIAGQFQVSFLPTGPEAPYESPTLATVSFWLIEWVFLAVVLFLFSNDRAIRFWRLIPAIWVLMGMVVLYMSSRVLPYNSLTTPEAFFDLRPSVSRLLVENSAHNSRFLSLSDMFFDSGDQAEIETIYQDQLPLSARYDYAIAIKQREVVSPNLSMIYGLPAVDGFDGGILPTQIYSRMTGLILGRGQESSDGRLRENLDQIPQDKWLDLFNARYVITDKVGDLWRDGIFFDRQHPLQLSTGQQAVVGYLPDYEGTGVLVLASNLPGPMQVRTVNGQQWEITFDDLGDGLYAAEFPQPAALESLRITSCPSIELCQIDAITIVDQRDQTFHSLVQGSYRLIHSGDVKIYENLDVLPRAFMVYDWQWVGSLDEAIERMIEADFEPSRTAVLINPDPNDSKPVSAQLQSPDNQVSIVQYDPERVLLNVETDQDGYLILSDSFYPSWKASLDGDQVTIEQADGLFRAVFVPAGMHRIVFELVSQSYNYGRAISLGGLIFITLLFILIVRSKRRSIP